jgi:small redox-active disulfide protein 2
MKVQVLGPGCPKCGELTHRTEEALGELGLDTRVEKVTDLREIQAFGVMMTPALVVDGEVRFQGRVPSVNDIKKQLSVPHPTSRT